MLKEKREKKIAKKRQKEINLQQQKLDKNNLAINRKLIK